jgi:hypothetical protein
MYRELMAKHLDKKGTLAYANFPLVNWEAIDRALQARSPSFCAWVTKHVSGECGVGRRMKLWKFWEKDNCPCCDKEDETTTHFPFCDSPHMQEAYTKQLDSFITWIKETDTDPAIAVYFTTVLQDKAFPPTLDEMEPHIDQAAQHQQSIGWDNLLFGRIATSWMELQRDHFKTTNSRRSPERWAADMAYRLLQLSHGLWMARNGYLHERDEQGLLLKEDRLYTMASPNGTFGAKAPSFRLTITCWMTSTWNDFSRNLPLTNTPGWQLSPKHIALHVRLDDRNKGTCEPI